MAAKYRLKKGQERFQVVDGPLAGRDYRPGAEYDEKDVPAAELKRRFEKVPEAVGVESSKPEGESKKNKTKGSGGEK